MHIGIDPGLSGAVAVLDAAGALVALCDTPTLTLSTSRGTRQEYDVPGLAALLQPYAAHRPMSSWKRPRPCQGKGCARPGPRGTAMVSG